MCVCVFKPLQCLWFSLLSLRSLFRGFYSATSTSTELLTTTGKPRGSVSERRFQPSLHDVFLHKFMAKLQKTLLRIKDIVMI